MSNLEIEELKEYYFGKSSRPFHYGPGVLGLILYPNGSERWLNQKMDLMTGQVSFGGPIINKVRELVKKQDKTIFIPFGDEEMFYLMPWWSKNSDNIENGSIDEALKIMELVETIYKADPEWRAKYYNES